MRRSGGAGRHRVDEALARGADQERQAERLELRQPGDARPCSAPASCRSRCRDRARSCRARCRPVGDVERAGEEGLDVGHDVDRGIGGVAVVHDHDRHAVLGDDARHVGIALQAPDVVDDGRARRRAPRPRPSAFMVSIETGTPSASDRRQHRFEPPQFLLQRDRDRAAIGPGRFRADVDDVGAFRDHAAGMLDGALGIEELAAVGERVRRDVEDAHHRAGGRAPAAAQAACGAPSPACAAWKWAGGPRSRGALCAAAGRGVKARADRQPSRRLAATSSCQRAISCR